MWLLIIHGFLASTGAVWLLVVWPIAMSSNPTDPSLFMPYLIGTLVASAVLVLIGPFVLVRTVRKFLRYL